MLTITPTVLAQRVPGSPAQIPPDASLADLWAIKASWAQSARDLGYPEMACKVTTWLGREIVMSPSGRVFKVWSRGNVFALLREYSERYLPVLDTHLILRSLTIYTGQPDTRRANLVDQIVLSEQVSKVVSWRWQLIGKELLEMEHNYFLPGRWFDVFLNAESEAEGTLQQAHNAQTENERLHLLAEMLAGQVV